jgi:hypothetical protein
LLFFLNKIYITPSPSPILFTTAEDTKALAAASVAHVAASSLALVAAQDGVTGEEIEGEIRRRGATVEARVPGTIPYAFV